MSKRWAGDPYWDTEDDRYEPDTRPRCTYCGDDLERDSGECATCAMYGCPHCGAFNGGDEDGALCPTCYEEQENARDMLDEEDGR